MFSTRTSPPGRRWGSAVFLALLGGLLPAGFASAQQRSMADLLPPQLLIVTPAGGKAGTTVEVTVSGFNLSNSPTLLFSQAGIKAEVIKQLPPPPLDPKNKKKKKGPKPLGVPTATRYKVTISANTPVGFHDVRVITPGGISNPRTFVVGDLDEALEKEPNNDVAQAQKVELNTTINGTIASPTDVDYYAFSGKKGQRVVVSCLSSSIDSRLPVTVQIYDSKDRQLAFNRGYHENDALADCTLADDGDYYVRISSFTYTQGGPEYFYRLSISTAPWIDVVYPNVVEPGKKATVTVYGRNLPGGKLDPKAVVDGQPLEKLSITLDVPNDPVALQRLKYSGRIAPRSSALDGFEYRIHNDSGTSNPYLLTYARAPVVLDNEANDTPDTAQEITLPCEIAGRIEKKRDLDWYTFTAEKGEVYSIEAYGDRLGAPIDLYMVLRNGTTKKTIVELDDNLDRLGQGQFFTRSEDPPRYRFVVPQDGSYQLLVASREATIQAGPRDVYRVRITREQPDFRLVVMPSAPNSPDACIIRRGGHQDYSVFVWRLDGFGGDVTVSIDGLPDGVICKPQTIGGGVREASLVLKATADAPFWTGTVKVKGTATVNGKTVVREARPATITWGVPQPNIPTISRLDRSLVLAVRDKPPYTLDAGIDSVVALHGTNFTVPLKLTRLWADFKSPVRILPLNLPGRLRFNQLVLTPGKDKAKLVINVPNNVPPGVYTLVLRGQSQFVPGKGKKIKGRLNPFLVQPASPIMVTVLPRQLATVSLGPNRLKVKPGTQTEVVVKVTSRYDFYTGGYKVLLVLPSKTKGIRAEEVTIPGGKDSARLVIEIDDEVKPGANFNPVVRVTAMIGGKPIKQEARLSVSVVK